MYVCIYIYIYIHIYIYIYTYIYTYIHMPSSVRPEDAQDMSLALLHPVSCEATY